jgi:hypothetical protein
VPAGEVKGWRQGQGTAHTRCRVRRARRALSVTRTESRRNASVCSLAAAAPASIRTPRQHQPPREVAGQAAACPQQRLTDSRGQCGRLKGANTSTHPWGDVVGRRRRGVVGRPHGRHGVPGCAAVGIDGGGAVTWSRCGRWSLLRRQHAVPRARRHPELRRMGQSEGAYLLKPHAPPFTMLRTLTRAGCNAGQPALARVM